MNDEQHDLPTPQVSYPLQSEENCRAAYGEDYGEGMVCAGLESGGVGWCNGDRGAPLVCPDREGESLTGLSSWGYGCGLQGYPDVFTSTPYFRHWIGDNIEG